MCLVTIYAVWFHCCFVSRVNSLRMWMNKTRLTSSLFPFIPTHTLAVPLVCCLAFPLLRPIRIKTVYLFSVGRRLRSKVERGWGDVEFHLYVSLFSFELSPLPPHPPPPPFFHFAFTPNAIHANSPEMYFPFIQDYFIEWIQAFNRLRYIYMRFT